MLLLWVVGSRVAKVPVFQRTSVGRDDQHPQSPRLLRTFPDSSRTRRQPADDVHSQIGVSCRIEQ
jgi:hypothetical protein